MKTLITTIIILLCLVFAAESKAEYNTSDTAASASTQQKLYLTILPAFETVEFGTTISETPLEITVQKTVAIRANTSWGVNVQPLSYGFVNSAYCLTNGTIGLSNGDAGVGDGFQLFTIQCVQSKSWSDNENASFNLYYNVGPDASL